MTEWTKASTEVISIAERLIDQHHKPLLDARIGFIFRDKPQKKQGKVVLARAQKVAERLQPYLDLDPDEIVNMAGGTLAVVDCFGILDDVKIERYFELGCEVKGLGRGHINRIKDKVRKRKMAT